MRCPYCKNLETKVTDSRDADDCTSVRRRRECLACGKRFTTYENVELTEIRVIKKSGVRESFNRDKLRGGITRACEKLKISADQIESVVKTVERKAMSESSREITSERIGNLVMAELKKLDQVAYVRFASVYREFKDISSFMDELKKLMRSNNRKGDM